MAMGASSTILVKRYGTHFNYEYLQRVTRMMTTHIPHVTMTHTRYSTKYMTRVKESLFPYGTHHGQDPK